MSSCDFLTGDFLYHAVHGLCRVSEIKKSADHDGNETTYYSLVPHVTRHGNHRFSFAASDLSISGFHTPMSTGEAQSILNYLRKGQVQNISERDKANPVVPDFSADIQPWALAKLLLSCAHDAPAAKELRRRRSLERAARGLVVELAHVMKIPITEAIRELRKSLECSHKLEPIVLAALTNAAKE